MPRNTPVTYRMAPKASPSGRPRLTGLLIVSTLAIVGGLALSGCVTTSDTNLSTPTRSATPSDSAGPAVPGAEPVDPLVDLKDPGSTDFVEGEISTLIHERGTGPKEFEIERPEAPVSAVKFFVSCEPSSTFTVTTSTFYSGPCSTHFSSSGSIPLEPGDGPLTVSIDVPEDTTFWLVALPVQ